ncbi:MAG: hypothetical protein MO852_12135 [Candidatus Devosia euplotis]|nr:hypothetical protein [Candidatus Devosia euplotis]
MLKSGRMLGARGGNDAHHDVPDAPEQIVPLSIEVTGNYLGTPTTWIFAKARTRPAILEALVAGHASVSFSPRNPRVELWVDHDSDGVMDMMMGDNVKPPETRSASRCGWWGGWHCRARYKVRVIKNRDDFATLFTDAASRSILFTDAPDAGERNYYRVEIEGPHAPYLEAPNSMAQSQNMAALSNPLYFNYDPHF